MHLKISNVDGVPIYQQIVNQVRHLIAAGRLQPNDELLPIRLLAEQLTVNPNTVARAYLELERAGIVTKRHGSGTYVSENAPALNHREKLKELQQRVDPLLVAAAHLDVDLEDVLELVRERYRLIHSGIIK
ncbi:MAG: ytrA 1 [Verrucomicrobia bacterium]|jgi:GntR family transcriptional regulator|nr:ytrA 1 [Verrucomicrobiota bacterium]